MSAEIALLRSQMITVTNIFAILVLVPVLCNSRVKRGSASPDRKLFFGIVVSCIAIITFDTLGWVSEALRFENWVTACYTFDSLYLLLQPVASALWLFYVDYKIYGDAKRIYRLIPLYIAPVIINTVIIVANLFKPFIFYIDPVTGYTRMSYMPLTMIMAYIGIAVAFILTSLNFRKITRKSFVALMLFPVPPLLFSIVQMMNYGFSLIWLGVAFSILIVFVNVQNSMANIDYLTGIPNRRALEEFLAAEFSRRDKTRKITGLMLDLDNFKMINDTFGHKTGDDALEQATKLLKKCTRKNDFIARYAGDEFVLILKSESDDVNTKMEKRIRDCAEAYNESSGKPYLISFSIGSDVSDGFGRNDMEAFLKNMDANMYIDKKTKGHSIR